MEVERRNKLEDMEHQESGKFYKFWVEIKKRKGKKKAPGKLNLMTIGKRKPETYKFPQEGTDL